MSFPQFPPLPQLDTLGLITAVADIAIVAYVIYKIFMLIEGTRAIQLLKGLAILVLADILSNLLNLSTISWILSQTWAVLIFVLAVIFQPELRRVLEQLGRGPFFSVVRSELAATDVINIIDEITRAVVACAKTKTGALLVIERSTGLKDYIETGRIIDAQITEDLLVNIFVPHTPLHDGAAIIRGSRLLAAACFLPLTDNPYISTSLGTRHRAAIGISEISDCLVLVVSEETGIISLAQDGKLVRFLDEKQLKDKLAQVFAGADSQAKPFWRKNERKKGKKGARN
ncbi:MAG: diadenylate cyclase CdaA [Clostridiales bacterium]|nr:diadenylate cyclase CdaA [Clostridiales bacterium]